MHEELSLNCKLVLPSLQQETDLPAGLRVILMLGSVFFPSSFDKLRGQLVTKSEQDDKGLRGAGEKRGRRWESGRADSTAVLLLGEQHDTEAESKVATVQGKINTAKPKPFSFLNLVCSFKRMYTVHSFFYIFLAVGRRSLCL